MKNKLNLSLLLGIALVFSHANAANQVSSDIDIQKIVGKWGCSYSMPNSNILMQSIDQFNADGTFSSQGAMSIEVPDGFVNSSIKLDSKWQLVNKNQLRYTDVKILDIQSDQDAFKALLQKSYQKFPETTDQIDRVDDQELVFHMIQPEIDHAEVMCRKQ